jgi:signal transduction histidine kinase
MADDLPKVGVDRFSITAVLTNLVDNAIKYSAGKGKKIVIKAELNGDGVVETTVKDRRRHRRERRSDDIQQVPAQLP